MCGIVGIISKRKNGFTYPDQDTFKEMLICDAIRGEDSTGIFSVLGSGNAEWVKLGAKPHNLFGTSEYTKWKEAVYSKGRAMVGHNRKATQGGITNANTHPFVFGNTVLIHNGSIDNFRSLLSHREREKWGVEVDSHAAAILFARNDPEKLLGEMRGAFTFVWYNVLTKVLSFIRNDERPLYFANGQTKVYFASEAGMLQWLLNRRNIETTISNLKPGVLFQLNLEKEDLQWEHKKIPLASEKFVSVPNSTSSHTVPSPAEIARRNIARLLQRTNPNIEIPDSDKFNIHYGGDILVEENEVPHQQIVFTVEDFKPLDPARPKNERQKYIIWGTALDSEYIQVSTIFEGLEDEVETLAYSPHLIGLIGKIQMKRNKDNTKWIQDIDVTQVRTVEMTVAVNGTPLTVEHLKHINDNEMCRCNVSCSQFNTKDLRVTTEGPKLEIVCQYCYEHDLEMKANETPTNPAI